ncbi:MAG: hypothetical protein ACLUE2_12850 [Bacteroides cellulosilyticus]
MIISSCRGTQISAQLQFARAVARRAERRLWTLNREKTLYRKIFCALSIVFLTFSLSWHAWRCSDKDGTRNDGKRLLYKRKRKQP